MGERVVGESDGSARLLAGQVAAGTGANGKTTTTSLAGEIIAAGNLPVLVGGNIGTPAITFVDQAGPATWTVLEVSSFQLETIVEFRPRMAVILNITPDHLDRHKTFDNYVNAKARIFENQRAEDFTILNADDPKTAELSKRTSGQVFWFSRKNAIEKGAFARGTHMYFCDGHFEREILPLSEIPLKGGHNLENVLAGVCIGVLAGCEPEQIRHAVQTLKPVEQRL